MKSFQDTEGRHWRVHVDVATVKRVRDLLDIDLLDIFGGDLMERLIGDPVTLCDVIYGVCKPEADQAGITDEQFGQALAGDAIESASMALIDALVDFFPLGKRRLLQAAVRRSREMEEKALTKAQEKLDDPETMAELEKRLDGLSMSWPESSGSTRRPSPFES